MDEDLIHRSVAANYYIPPMSRRCRGTMNGSQDRKIHIPIRMCALDSDMQFEGHDGVSTPHFLRIEAKIILF